VIIGDRELAEGVLPLKSLASGDQEMVAGDELVQIIITKLQEAARVAHA
jgi:histidyl-tRNA synthetase